MLNEIEQAIYAIQAGEMVVVMDDEDRENEGDLVMAAEKADKKAVNFMMTHGRGLICAPLDPSIIERLELPLMEQKNTEAHLCQFTVSVDYKKGTSTGISAQDRALSIQALADPKSKASDFARPGHIFPLKAR